MIILGHCLASDAALIECLCTVRATRRLGSAVDGWPGCYSLAVVLPRELLLLTDPVGQFPLYTVAASGGVWFGSSAAGLARHVNAGVDRVSLAASIACVDMTDISESRSAFRDVRRIPPGSTVTVDAGGISVKPWAG